MAIFWYQILLLSLCLCITSSYNSTLLSHTFLHWKWFCMRYSKIIWNHHWLCQVCVCAHVPFYTEGVFAWNTVIIRYIHMYIAIMCSVHVCVQVCVAPIIWSVIRNTQYSSDVQYIEKNIDIAIISAYCIELHYQ